MELHKISDIKELLNKHGFKFSKSLGQNFLINKNICPKMAESSIKDPSYCVIEIGPGIGILTKELAKRAKKVVAIELDKRLIPILKETLSSFENIKIILDDILKIDLRSLIKDEFSENEKICVCANLPYYITSPVIMKLLESKINLENITLMIQKETADRICSPLCSRKVGAISFAVRYYSEPLKLFNVSKNSFIPAPKVDSSVIQLNLLKKPAVQVLNEKMFFLIIKSAFGKRRKTLINSLSSDFGISKKILAETFENLNFNLNIRPEEMTMKNFADLSDSFIFNS